MAENTQEQFKISLVGGYDKQEVDERFQSMRDAAETERTKLQAEKTAREEEVARLDSRLQELTEEVDKKEAEAATLRENIEGKYKSYIDNYDMIGRLANESRVKAEEIRSAADKEKLQVLEDARKEAGQIRADAETDAQKLREEADADARKLREEAQAAVDEERAEGQVQYEATQEELNGVVEQFNRVQHHFMQSYRSIQEIASK